MTEAVVRIWDLPTRLFHWALVLVVAAMFATALLPGVPVDWHARCGYAVLALLVFRTLWGFVGGYWSRFRTFVPSWRRMRDYLSGRAAPELQVGHSPLGALSVFAMLLTLFAQVGTGLVADDEIAFTGPLNRYVSTSTGLAATEWHKGAGQWLLVALIGLHLAAVFYYLAVRKRNLIAGMVHGDQRAPAPVPASRDTPASRLLALSLLAMSFVAVALLVRTG
ncbi:cytochrome b/b6 domain-containing protein [Ramlibacter sp. AN1015]|uniref:cytochrome b/b6 domain-containing protein n=1 Tax=Ramlibacter sp. AN1015 TaxID=3133428 RepID=UPI0030C323DF